MGIEFKPTERQKKLSRKLGPRKLLKVGMICKDIYNKVCGDCRVKLELNDFEFCSNCRDLVKDDLGKLERIKSGVNKFP